MRIITFCIAILLLSGCSLFKPQTDICSHFSTQLQQSYCYASNEVTAARKAVRQSLIDGAITKSQAIKARDLLNEADAILDSTSALIHMGDEEGAQQNLRLTRSILLELKK